MTRESRVILALDGPRLSIPLDLARRLGGDLQAAAFLSQSAFLSALAIQRHPENRGWFFLAQEGGPWLPANEKESIFAAMGSWESALGISPDGQKSVRKKLLGLGLLEEKKAGIPGRLHYRVDSTKYLDFLAGDPANTPVSGKPGNKNPEKRETRTRKTGKLDSGKSGIKNPAFPDPNKEIERGDRNEIEAAAPRASAHGSNAAAPQSDTNKNKRRRQRPSGIVTWTTDDELEAQRIECEHGADEIGAAVAALVEAGKEPVPGSVLLRLNQQARQKAAGQEAAAHRAAGEVEHEHQVALATAAKAMGEQLFPAGMPSRMASQGR